MHGLAYSTLRYGITTYGHSSKTLQDKVDAILKSLLKSVCYDQNVHTDVTLFSFLQLPSFDTLLRETVILRHYWSDTFKTNRMPSKSLRNQRKYVVPPARTRYGESVRNRSVTSIFNAIPSDCMNLNSRSKLKKALKCLRDIVISCCLSSSPLQRLFPFSVYYMANVRVCEYEYCLQTCYCVIFAFFPLDLFIIKESV